MKRIVFCVFEDLDATRDMLYSLKDLGYNGTLMGSSSVNRSFACKKKAGQGAFFSLSDYAEGVKEPNLTAFFLVDEEEADKLKQLIREGTEEFSKIHGVMFSFPVSDYEGSI
ncbi:MAG: hypothetical protein Q4F15_05455 [Bacillota bacterium]|nr:hypothetical protein [Bacillota bacterium]